MDLEKIISDIPLEYKDQFRKREFNFDEKWENNYKPLDHIDDNLYKEINRVPDEDEWTNICNEVKNNSASGISRIGYRLVKKLGLKDKELV